MPERRIISSARLASRVTLWRSLKSGGINREPIIRWQRWKKEGWVCFSKASESRKIVGLTQGGQLHANCAHIQTEADAQAPPWETKTRMKITATMEP